MAPGSTRSPPSMTRAFARCSGGARSSGPKRRGLLRNVCGRPRQLGDPSRRPVLERLLADEDPLVREHAQWGLDRLDGALT